MLQKKALRCRQTVENVCTMSHTNDSESNLLQTSLCDLSTCLSYRYQLIDTATGPIIRDVHSDATAVAPTPLRDLRWSMLAVVCGLPIRVTEELV